MIQELLRPTNLSLCANEVEAAIRVEHNDAQVGNQDALTSIKSHDLSVADMSDALEAMIALRERGFSASNRDAALLTRDPVASILQAALEEHYYDVGAVSSPQGQGLAGGVVPPITDVSLKAEWRPSEEQGLLPVGKFTYTDPRWLSRFIFAKALARARGRHAFNPVPATPVKIGDRARVIIVGDWGSGLPRAQEVSGHMREYLVGKGAQDRECHVIHLGDVYFAGFESEYRKRFLPYWPVRPNEAQKFGSWSLNANHDMFSGGDGYFDVLLKDQRFAKHEGSSYFSLQNSNWLLLGLDTGYEKVDPRGEEGTLFGPQAAWAMERCLEPPTKKVIFLSHHQLFSSWEKGSATMQAALGPILTNPNIKRTAWFWGHEHRCAAYTRRDDVGHARLIGHGGVPVKASDGSLLPGVAYEYTASFSRLATKYAYMGFAVLDFDADRISIVYVNEAGEEHYKEVIK